MMDANQKWDVNEAIENMVRWIFDGPSSLFQAVFDWSPPLVLERFAGDANENTT